MAQLRLGYPEIEQRGAEILQITHNTAAEAERYLKHYPMTFPYLCDPDRAAHEAYGLMLQASRPLDPLKSTATAVLDFVSRGERTPLPLPFIARYGGKDSPQAVLIVDREGIVRYVVQSGPNTELPSNAEILRRLEAIR
jgi:alkyl hydroperoxide reductase subunit AhpC